MFRGIPGTPGKSSSELALNVLLGFSHSMIAGISGKREAAIIDF
jgi:hypothetical protein